MLTYAQEIALSEITDLTERDRERKRFEDMNTELLVFLNTPGATLSPAMRAHLK